jgi:excisionase family DNA binding protein
VITLISITAAAQVVNVSRKTIYQWIEKGLISTVRSAAGRQLVCFSSLFNARSKKFA